MTERDYVKHIRKIAEAYLAVVADEGGVGENARAAAKAARRWESVKGLLSPHTAIALCDAWLEKDPVLAK